MDSPGFEPGASRMPSIRGYSGTGNFAKIRLNKKTWRHDFAYYMRSRANLAEASVNTNLESMKVVLKRYPHPTVESVYLVKDVMLQDGLSNTYVNKVLTAATHFF